MLSKIKGWNFLPKPQKFSADGSSPTLETLKAEKTKLEQRLAEIPGLISKLQNSVKLINDDVVWLSGLNNRKAKQWEKENGKSAEQAIYDGKKTIVNILADITTFTNEKDRIPGQIKDVDTQISAIVTGESSGLSKGLSKDTSRQLGQLEVSKVQNQIATQKQIDQAQITKAKIEAEQAEQQVTKPPTSPQMKWGIIIGTAIILAIIGYMVYKHKQAVALAPPQPVKL